MFAIVNFNQNFIYFKGLIGGIPLFGLGLSISVIEIVRIIYGVTNRGISN
jgi:hypothetical protein